MTLVKRESGCDNAHFPYQKVTPYMSRHSWVVLGFYSLRFDKENSYHNVGKDRKIQYCMQIDGLAEECLPDAISAGWNISADYHIWGILKEQQLKREVS